MLKGLELEELNLLLLYEGQRPESCFWRTTSSFSKGLYQGELSEEIGPPDSPEPTKAFNPHLYQAGSKKLFCKR